jgi:hypothetical protein
MNTKPALKGNYAYATGSLEGLIKDCCIELEHNADPKAVARKMRLRLDAAIKGLEGEDGQ